MDNSFEAFREKVSKLEQDLANAVKPSIPDPNCLALYIPPSEAEQVIACFVSEVESWKKAVPENKHLVVVLAMPDGANLSVEYFDVVDNFVFRASGYVDGIQNFVVGHISTLMFRAYYEDNIPGAKGIGFKAVIQSHHKSGPKEQDS
jgi:hypothetical protein